MLACRKDNCSSCPDDRSAYRDIANIISKLITYSGLESATVIVVDPPTQRGVRVTATASEGSADGDYRNRLNIQ